MTALGRAVEPSEVEPPAQQIARRLRGILAERRISGSALAAELNMDQRAVSRRLIGATDFTINELALVANALDMKFSELCAIRDSNPEPADLEERQAPRLTSVPFVPVQRTTSRSVTPPTEPRPRRGRRHLELVSA